MTVSKRIPGYEDYWITRDGNVWSVRKRRYPRKLSLSLNARGYYRVALCADGAKPRTIEVHRLIAAAFLPNPKGLPEINHLDGVKTNNALDNLEWCSRSSNMKHAARLGLWSPPMQKLTAEDVRHIRSRLDAGELHREIAHDYGVARSTISLISARTTWAATV